MVVGSEPTSGWILRILLVWHKLPYLGSLKYPVNRLNYLSPLDVVLSMVGKVSRALKKEVKHKALVILNRMCAKVRVQKLVIGVKK